MLQDWDLPINPWARFLGSHGSCRARSSAGKLAGQINPKKGDSPVESVGTSNGKGGSSCLEPSNWDSGSEAVHSSCSGGYKSALSQPCSLVSLPCKVEDSEDERSDFNSAASSVPLSSSSGLEEEDVYLSMPSVSLVERSKGSDELTPLQQIRQAVYATSDAIVRMGSWSSKARRRAMVSPDPPRLPQPSLQEDKAWTASIPVCNNSHPSTSTGGLAQPHKTVRGLSCCLSSRTPPTGSMGISPLHNLNSRVIPTGSMEKDAQPTQLKPCLSSGSELKPVKHVSFAPGGFDKTRGSSNKLDACGPSSHHRLQAPSSPDLSAMQYSSAGMYFFQGALGSCSRRTSSSGQASSALRRSWAGDPDFTEQQNLQDAGEEKEEEEEQASQLEFYQFAKPFGLGQGEELQMYVCGPPGDEDHARNKDLTGCVVWRGKSGKRTRRNGYMLEAEQVERCCGRGGMIVSWPVKLANAIVATTQPAQ